MRSSASATETMSPRRHFTLEQANRSLPLVRRIVGDIVAATGQAESLQDRLGGASTVDRPTLQAKLDELVERLEDYVDELTEVGCELKDYRKGLIDFTGTHEGRDVCLCWQLGEPAVEHWHELDRGFAGRQPVQTLREDESATAD